MRIWRLKNTDGDQWLSLRRQLWPALEDEQHRAEMATMLSDEARFAVFGCETDGGMVGFAEASLRDRPDALPAQPIGYVEALFVEPGARGKGVGTALLGAAEDWSRACGCERMGSDADVGNEAGLKVHRALGFSETERIVRFEKVLV